MNARKIALDILMDVEGQKAYSNIAIQDNLAGHEISHLDKKLITEIVYGVLENKIYLDFIIGQLSKIKLSDLDKTIKMILRMGLYQILYLDKIPTFAIVNESVKLAKKANFKASGYVNGILRNFLRNQRKIKIPTIKDEPIKYLSIKYSHPEWLVKMWVADFGLDFTEELLKSNNKKPPLTIRTNTLKIHKKELIRILKAEGTEVSDGTYTKDALYIKNIGSITKLESFKNGYFQVQDESSMLAVDVLDPRPGDRIIDVCAAPGGKSTYMAQLMKNKGIILSRDIYEHKIRLIQDNAVRLGIKIIQTELFDATKLDKNLIGSADKVLVDAPCSGLGVIRRKPELKYNKEPKDLDMLVEFQSIILNNASRYVRRGGVLVYSTCTINKAENQNIIYKFIQENKEFEILDANTFLSSKLKKDDLRIQLYPNIDYTDGFFICRLGRL